MKEQTLSCCDAGRLFIGLDYIDGTYLTNDGNVEAYLNHVHTVPPSWTMRVKIFNEEWGAPPQYPPSVKCCPFCSTAVPQLQLRATPPEKIMVIVDGCYYCSTCTKRLPACMCDPPTNLWEPVQL